MDKKNVARELVRLAKQLSARDLLEWGGYRKFQDELDEASANITKMRIEFSRAMDHLQGVDEMLDKAEDDGVSGVEELRKRAEQTKRAFRRFESKFESETEHLREMVEWI